MFSQVSVQHCAGGGGGTSPLAGNRKRHTIRGIICPSVKGLGGGGTPVLAGGGGGIPSPGQEQLSPGWGGGYPRPSWGGEFHCPWVPRTNHWGTPTERTWDQWKYYEMEMGLVYSIISHAKQNLDNPTL